MPMEAIRDAQRFLAGEKISPTPHQMGKMVFVWDKEAWAWQAVYDNRVWFQIHNSSFPVAWKAMTGEDLIEVAKEDI